MLGYESTKNSFGRKVYLHAIFDRLSIGKIYYYILVGNASCFTENTNLENVAGIVLNTLIMCFSCLAGNEIPVKILVICG